MEGVLDILIEEMGSKGDGIGTMPDGARVFVPGALPGERVKLAGLEPREEGVRGILESVIDASPDRVTPPCVYFGQCGGCALQHMGVGYYGNFKMARVRQALERFSLDPGAIEGPLASPPGSRRRAVLSARCSAAGVVHLGFNERASHVLSEIESCMVLSSVLVKKMPVLREFLPRIMEEGESYDIALAESGGLVDLLVTVLGKKGRECSGKIAANLRELGETGGFARVSWQASRGKPPQVIAGPESYRVRFGDFEVIPPPGAFLQATAEGEAALTRFALSAITKKSRIADLYAGCGTFALSLLSQGHRVDAFEGDAAALAALAAAGAGQSGLGTARRDLAKEPLTFQELKPYDAVVIDPPRLGALAQMAEIGRSGVQKVVSISCNPDTFARDTKTLVQKGFKIRKIAVIDQFLWTAHVEVAALLVRAA